MGRKKKPPAGAPAWMVTFADLMSLLVCFFVLILSFSIPAMEIIQRVAGSLKDSFGVQRENDSLQAVQEVDPLPFAIAPEKFMLLNTTATSVPQYKPEDGDQFGQVDGADDPTGVDVGDSENEIGDGALDQPTEGRIVEEAAFDAVEQTLIEAFQNDPDLGALAQSLSVERTEEGLKIELLDQDRFSMFPAGAATPYDQTQMLLAKVAQAVAQVPNRLSIIGHTDGTPFVTPNGYSNWELSADRANAVRQSILAAGIDEARIAGVEGRAAKDPIDPDNPTASRNRRISMLLLSEFDADDGNAGPVRPAILSQP
jgi:chemotaxis protein MotB